MELVRLEPLGLMECVIYIVELVLSFIHLLFAALCSLQCRGRIIPWLYQGEQLLSLGTRGEAQISEW